jgi:hypothetical protein
MCYMIISMSVGRSFGHFFEFIYSVKLTYKLIHICVRYIKFTKLFDVTFIGIGIGIDINDCICFE